MKIKTIHILNLLIVAICMQCIFNACTERIEPCEQECDTISFKSSLKAHTSPAVKSFSANFTSTMEERKIMLDSKAPITTQLSGVAGVYGYQFDTWSEDLTQWEAFENIEFTFNGDELTSNRSIRWGALEKNNIRIFVHTPKKIQGATISATGTPTITYTLPSDIAMHSDIITASAQHPKTYRHSIPLTFNHALTALKFKMGFDCTVKSITISGVFNKATYKISEGWRDYSKYTDANNNGSYVLSFSGAGKAVKKDEELNTNENVMMMIPQTIPDGATITVVYDNDQSISASLAGLKWEEGKLITYTLHKHETLSYIYIDLAAGNFTVDGSSYSGYVYSNNGTTVSTVSGTHKSENKYYVYQSTSSNRNSTGWSGAPNTSTFTLPSYNKVYMKVNGKDVEWGDFITNNTSVTAVIKAWDDEQGAKNNSSTAKGAVRNVGRESTKNYITVKNAVGTCDLYIDNIYTSYANNSVSRTTGGIGFVPSGGNNSLIINTIGDNRLSCVHYNSNTTTNQLIFQGLGTLTVADADYNTTQSGDYGEPANNDTTFYSNHWNAAIGSSDSYGDARGIVINSGIIYAGTTKAENCTAIGGGGNGTGIVTINGGVITAVATTTGTAIGGGIGYHSAGGAGTVVINGGNVYAYNHANRWNIPSSAIGGAGSNSSSGSTGNVTINGGNIYAQSALGTAIGGGSSATTTGGSATINIKDGIVIAKSLVSSAGIGGGSTNTKGGTMTATNKNGGNATVNIGEGGGKPIIRTGSIGGGYTNAEGGKIGSAIIKIYGGDIQAQFVMAASESNSFTMSGGIIRNSYSTDDVYKHIEENGGAVYMEEGNFTMTNGTIQNCSAELGGAVYIKGTNNTRFTMSGGTILNCSASNHGGALYLDGGNVTLSGGTIINNMAERGNGGGIYISEGNFSMPNASTAVIRENAAVSKNQAGYGNGGGIYITSSKNDVTVDILSGSIIYNTSDRNGGGISVDMRNSNTIAANVNVAPTGSTNNTNPLIEGNRTTLFGGGLYVNGVKANVIINGGRIKNNSTASYVPNSDVANEGGMVTLNGGDVTSVIVTYDCNGGYIKDKGDQQTATQRIVTSTNSKMVLPETFERLGYTLAGWHTRPDGDNNKGKFYATGATLNISDDLTLYALWE